MRRRIAKESVGDARELVGNGEFLKQAENHQQRAAPFRRRRRLDGIGHRVGGFHCARGFRFSEAKVYLPIEQMDPVDLHSRENHPGLQVIGRLRPGVTMATAQAEIASIGNQLSHHVLGNRAHGSSDQNRLA